MVLIGKIGPQRYALSISTISFYHWTYKKNLERVEIDRNFDFRGFFPNRLFLDICMPNGLGGIKMHQIGTILVKCDDLSIATISFYPRPLEKFLQEVEVGCDFDLKLHQL